MRINDGGIEMTTLVPEEVYRGGLFAIGVEGNPSITIEDVDPGADLRGNVQLKALVKGGVTLNQAAFGWGTNTSLRVGTGADVGGLVALRRAPRTYRRGLMDVQILAPVTGKFTLTDGSIAHGQLEVSVLRHLEGSVSILTRGDWKFCNVRLEISGMTPTQITCQGMACKATLEGDELQILLDPDLDSALAGQIKMARWADHVNAQMMEWEAQSRECTR